VTGVDRRALMRDESLEAVIGGEIAVAPHIVAGRRGSRGHNLFLSLVPWIGEQPFDRSFGVPILMLAFNKAIRMQLTVSLSAFLA